MNARRANLHRHAILGASGRSFVASTIAVAMLVVLTLGFVSPAAAQVLPETAPPEARMVRNAAVWPGYVVIFVLGGIIVAISLMPSKRAHTD